MNLPLNNTQKLIIVAIIAGALVGSLATLAVQSLVRNDSDRIREFYLTENAVHVSPHSIRKAMDKGSTDFVLVDLRSAQEYEKEHVVGAISIPAYSDPDTSAYGDVERIVAAFSALPKGKDIVVYCYSMPCMTGRKIGLMLAGHGIIVKHLGIGWNEWRHYWNLWNHEHEWNATNASEYVSSGTQPGTPVKRVNSTACPIDNEFGC